MKDQSVYDVITSRIIDIIEREQVLPWCRPWSTGNQAAQNLVTKRAYRGVNVFLLSSLHYESPYFLSYKQAQDLGGHVKRGEKGCPVVFWKWLEVDDQETGGKKRIPLLRYFTVFNVAQCEGVPVPTVTAPVTGHNPIEAAEKIVAGMPKRPEIKHGYDKAYYAPAQDLIAMPSLERFNSPEEYHSTLFHELVHSTGHLSRLNRKGVSGSEGKWSSFGSDSYSREELCAECGSSFLCAEAGIIERTVNNSAAYIASWLKALRNDSKLIVIAAAQATRAVEFILGKTQPAQVTEGGAQ